MNGKPNSPIWVGKNLYRFPTAAGAAKALAWLKDHPDDVAQFEIQFPDAVFLPGPSSGGGTTK